VGETRVAYFVPRHVELSQTFVRDEIAEMRRQGVHVDLFAIDRGDRPDVDADATFVREAYPWGLARVVAHALAFVRHPKGYARYLTDAWRMRVEKRWVPASVVPQLVADLRRRGDGHLHAHFAWGGAALALLASDLTDLPWSMTLHARDMWASPKNLELKLERASQLVTVCEYNRNWLEAHHRIQRPLELVVCGVSVPPEPAREFDVDVVAVGRLVPKKGFDVLVDAIAKLHPGIRAEIIGDGPEHDRLAARIRALGVEDRVRLTGPMSHDECLQRISRARLLCLPARIDGEGDRDSMPVVIKEAMARSRPVVATDVVGIPEMVDEEVGRLVPPDDPAALAEAIAEVLADESLARRLGEAARARVLERFTIEGEVAKLRAVFERATAAA
jgi:glycosyltransferase involved in cell wall biosynthesis